MIDHAAEAKRLEKLIADQVAQYRVDHAARDSDMESLHWKTDFHGNSARMLMDLAIAKHADALLGYEYEVVETMQGPLFCIKWFVPPEMRS